MLLVLCSQVLAATADPEAALKRADELLEAIDYRQAAAGFETACSAAPCTQRQLLRAYLGQGSALASSGQGAKAAEAFKALLFVSPDWTLPAATSPRLRDPFEVAQVFWRTRPRPELKLNVPPLVAGQPARLDLALGADPLGMVATVVVRLRAKDRETALEPVAGTRAPGSDGGFKEQLELGSLPAGRVTLTAQARSASGSVLLESAPLEVDVAPPPPEPKGPGRLLFHVNVGGVLEPRYLTLGAEARLAVSALRVLDISLGALFGANTGLRAAVQVHLPHTFRVSPFIQARFALHRIDNLPAWGAGLGAGLALELGPGRLWLMVVEERYWAPQRIGEWAFLLALGYELDVPFFRVD